MPFSLGICAKVQDLNSGQKNVKMFYYQLIPWKVNQRQKGHSHFWKSSTDTTFSWFVTTFFLFLWIPKYRQRIWIWFWGIRNSHKYWHLESKRIVARLQCSYKNLRHNLIAERCIIFLFSMSVIHLNKYTYNNERFTGMIENC